MLARHRRSLKERIAHLFIPRESNNFRARLLHNSYLGSLVILILILQLFISNFIFIKPQILGYASQISPEKIVELTNAERAKAGDPPLNLSPTLSEAAQRKAGDMFAFNYWAHRSPSGREPWDFFKEVGYKFSFAGENLARDFTNPQAVVNAWMASAGHRENLLNPKYREIGVSVVDGTLGGVETTLVVQLFGTPIGAPVASAQKERPKVLTKGESKQVPLAQTSNLTPTPNPVTSSQTPASSFTKAAILSQSKNTEKVLISPFSLTKQTYLIVLFVLLGLVLLDGLVVYKKKICRLSGRSLAHFIFLGSILLIVILSAQGAIL